MQQNDGARWWIERDSHDTQQLVGRRVLRAVLEHGAVGEGDLAVHEHALQLPLGAVAQIREIASELHGVRRADVVMRDMPQRKHQARVRGSGGAPCSELHWRQLPACAGLHCAGARVTDGDLITNMVTTQQNVGATILQRVRRAKIDQWAPVLRQIGLMEIFAGTPDRDTPCWASCLRDHWQRDALADSP